MENQDLTMFEFALSLGNNIIVQRFFNVKNLNIKAQNSYDLYEEVTNICESISNDLKMKTLEYLDVNRHFYFEINEEGENIPLKTDTEEISEEYFKLQIKKDNKTIIERIFPAHYYHPKVRYSVDIRPKIRSILNTLSHLLSSNKVSTKHINYSLITW